MYSKNAMFEPAFVKVKKNQYGSTKTYGNDKTLFPNPYYVATERDYVTYLQHLESHLSAQKKPIAILFGNSYFLKTLTALSGDVKEIHQIDIDEKIIQFNLFLLDAVSNAENYAHFVEHIIQNADKVTGKKQFPIGSNPQFEFTKKSISSCILAEDEFTLCRQRVMKLQNNEISYFGHTLDVSKKTSVDHFLEEIDIENKQVVLLSLSNLLQFVNNTPCMELLGAVHISAMDTNFTLLDSHYDDELKCPISHKGDKDTLKERIIAYQQGNPCCSIF